ncbi:unnamed protein product [Lactuca virosa]|uniref:Uncharacterized protein n=1 Tax=Lactuca virosa TaxID=75947 RepID=A0AAU9LWJ0_9ASTR|nr:unnamed protein product [Lactuca virosa]
MISLLQLQSPDASPSMKIAALRTLSYTLKTLGEVPVELNCKEVLDDTAVAALSNSSPLGNNLKVELDSLSEQATVLVALASVSPKLPLGYPARLPRTMLDVARKMLTEASQNHVVATVEKEAGWLLLSSLLSSMPKEPPVEIISDPLSDMENDPYEDVHKQPKVHQALMYPLLVACKSISNLRKAAAQEVDDKVRQHSGLMVDQPDTLLQIQKEDGTGKEYPLGAALEATKNILIQDSIKLLLDFRVVFLSRVGIDIEAKRHDDWLDT